MSKITSLLDARMPQPHEYDALPRDVARRAHDLSRERSTCTDARVEEIDRELLSLLRPHARD